MNRIHSGKAYITQKQFVVMALIAVGVGVRFLHFLFVDPTLPYRLGGLYAEFARQIADHGYWLPKTIPYYTDHGIPFAYPPLPFYLEAILLDRLVLPKYAVVNFLPPVLATLGLPSFLVLARSLRFDDRAQIIALGTYALMPSAYIEQVEAGGLSEAFGGLCLIWFMIWIVNASRRPSVLTYLLIGLSWSTCVAGAPGVAYASLPVFFIFLTVQWVERRGRVPFRLYRLAFLSIVVGIFVSAPYWVTVLKYHGAEAFWAPFTNQHPQIFELFLKQYSSLSQFRIASGTTRFFVFDALVFIGLIGAFRCKKWLIAGWFLALFAIPREGVWLVSIPASLVAGIGGARVGIPVLRSLAGELSRNKKLVLHAGLAAIIVLMLLGNYLLITKSVLDNSNRSLSRQDFEMLTWINQHTEENPFVVLADNPNVIEWLPHIGRRTTLNVPFGAEWEPLSEAMIQEFNNHLMDCGTWGCIKDLLLTQGCKKVYFLIDTSNYERLAANSTKNNHWLNRVRRTDSLWLGTVY